jgi:hypothetical protein
MCGLYAKNASGGIFIGNTFNRCMLGQDASKPASSGTTNAEFDAMIRMIDCEDMGIWNNFFGYIDNGVPAGEPIPTFHLTKCDGIQIANNVFRRPYERLDVKD